MSSSLKPYFGDEPFLFASYGHCDSDAVLAELNRLNRLGYRVWFDRGIRIARDWADEIESALRRSSVVLVFLSARSLASKNVRDEIHFALDHGKMIVPIYLEKCDLQGGLRLRLSNIQAIHKHHLSSDEFADLVRKTLPRSLAQSHSTERIDIGTTLGIDFGTRNSVMAIPMASQPTILLNREGRRSTPSVLAWDETNGWLTGAPALAKASLDPENTFLSLKTKLGSDYAVMRGGRSYRAWQLIAIFLDRLRKDAVLHLRQEIRKVVVTVPVRFSRIQTAELCQAYEAAGFEIVGVTTEPTAVAVGYGAFEPIRTNITVIYDLGAGSFDVSIMDLGREEYSPKYDNCDVLVCESVNGDLSLGGDDFDRAIADLCVESFEKSHNLNLPGNVAVFGRILHEVENAKIALTAASSARIHLPYLHMHQGRWLHLDVTITRAKFEEVTKPLVDRTIKLCLEALDHSRRKVGDIQHVILAGLASQIPGVRNRVREFFKQDPVCTIDPGEAVAIGAADYGKQIELRRESRKLLVDVVSLPLGVMLTNGRFYCIVSQNASLPFSQTIIFISKNHQSSGVLVPIFEGFDSLAEENAYLGTISLSPSIRSGLEDQNQVELTFEIHNYLLTVKLKDLSSGEVNSIKFNVKGPFPLDGAQVRSTLLEPIFDLPDFL